MVERIRVMADKPRDKRRTDRRLQDPVAIGLPARVVARMKPVGHFTGVPDAHGRRQKVVERLEQVRARDRARRLEIGHLVGGVSSRVRAPRTPKLDRLSGLGAGGSPSVPRENAVRLVACWPATLLPVPCAAARSPTSSGRFPASSAHFPASMARSPSAAVRSAAGLGRALAWRLTRRLRAAPSRPQDRRDRMLSFTLR